MTTLPVIGKAHLTAFGRVPGNRQKFFILVALCGRPTFLPALKCGVSRGDSDEVRSSSGAFRQRHCRISLNVQLQKLRETGHSRSYSYDYRTMQTYNSEPDVVRKSGQRLVSTGMFTQLLSKHRFSLFWKR